MRLNDAANNIGRRVKFTTADGIDGYGTISGVAGNRVAVTIDGASKVNMVRALMVTLVPDTEGREPSGANNPL
jgi:hypothetical protein